MIRILTAGFALVVAGSGAVMAQQAHILAGSAPASPPKVEMRLAQTRLASRQSSLPPTNAMLDVSGRVVPMTAPETHADRHQTGCPAHRQMRPADIRKIAETQADEIGLPRELVSAVIRAEGLVGAEKTGSRPSILAANSGDTPCAVQKAGIGEGVAHLARMRQLYPAPIHHLVAYREGEESFLASGGVPDRPETLRFIVTALNELATPVGELSAAQHTGRVKRISAPPSPVAQQGTTERAPQSHNPDPRWVSGFVFNLE